MSDTNKISYTSKDAKSIFQDLIAAIPSLTDKWKNYAEDDPGIVLLKLASFEGDMLCYNMDFQVNEVFPQTALMRANAQKSYDLITYKMHWFRSASCLINITLTRPPRIPIGTAIQMTIPEFTEIITPNNTVYCIIGKDDIDRTIYLSSDATSATKTMTAVQGMMGTQFNITLDKIIDGGRIYVNNYNIEEDEQNNINYPHMRLCMYDNETNDKIEDSEWIKVYNLLDVNEEGRFFELRIDENNQPYLQLCDNYEEYLRYTDSYLGLTYILSDGKGGDVSENVGFTFNTVVYLNLDGSSMILNDYLEISNGRSSQGRNPETVAEAAKSAPKEARTLGVAITLQDYEILSKTVDDIRACRAVDYSVDVGTKFDNQNITNDVNIGDNGILKGLIISNIDGYSLEPGSVSITIKFNNSEGTEVTNTFEDDSAGNLLLNGTTRYGVSYINYTTGVFEIDYSSQTEKPSTTNIVSVTSDYNRLYAPYCVILQIVANDYGYVSEYTLDKLNTTLYNKTVATISYSIEDAKIKAIPFNIAVYAYEPWKEGDPSLTQFISNSIYTTLYEYFNDPSREFGEIFRYADMMLLIQNCDQRIKLADILYPVRNFQVAADEYPRLGPVTTNLEDNKNYMWLRDKIFDENLENNDAYDLLKKTIFGADSGDKIDFSVVLQDNPSLDDVTKPLNLISSVLVDDDGLVSPSGTKLLNISWWCSREDLIMTAIDNKTMWGNIQEYNLEKDTPITLYAIVSYMDADIIIADVPVNIILRKE